MTFDQITSLIALLISSGAVASVLYYRPRKRKENAEATTQELTAQGALLSQYEAFIDTMTEEKKQMQVELIESRAEAREARNQEKTERERVVTAYKERSDALVELEILRGQYKLADYNRCEIPTCKRRTPPRTEQQETE